MSDSFSSEWTGPQLAPGERGLLNDRAFTLGSRECKFAGRESTGDKRRAATRRPFSPLFFSFVQPLKTVGEIKSIRYQNY